MDSDFNFEKSTLDKIPVALIRENAEALRVAVDKQNPDYLELVDSVRKRGIMNPILVREIKDPNGGGKLYGLIDGLHRFNAAMDAGLEVIPAQIGSLEEGDLLEAQILANVHRIETKAAQYSKALVKILGSNPTLTISELAGRLSRSPKWLTERLGLVKLDTEIQKLVDSNELGLTNAYALAKLPVEKQKELLQQAIAKSPAEFVAQADNVRREVNKAKREGRPAVAVFEPDRAAPEARPHQGRAADRQRQPGRKRRG
jgi:ParB/RepB/Spo0J family partition protein